MCSINFKHQINKFLKVFYIFTLGAAFIGGIFLFFKFDGLFQCVVQLIPQNLKICISQNFELDFAFFIITLSFFLAFLEFVFLIAIFITSLKKNNVTIKFNYIKLFLAVLFTIFSFFVAFVCNSTTPSKANALQTDSQNVYGALSNDVSLALLITLILTYIIKAMVKFYNTKKDKSSENISIYDFSSHNLSIVEKDKKMQIILTFDEKNKIKLPTNEE